MSEIAWVLLGVGASMAVMIPAIWYVVRSEMRNPIHPRGWEARERLSEREMRRHRVGDD